MWRGGSMGGCMAVRKQSLKPEQGGKSQLIDPHKTKNTERVLGT